MSRASELSVALEARQTNHEGVIVDWLGAAPGAFDGVLLNAGGYTHTSVAIRDAISAAALPCVEVHLTNTDAREPFRRRSLIAPVCSGRIMGFGGDSYLLGLDGLLRILARR